MSAWSRFSDRLARRRNAAAYVRRILAEPAEQDVVWLSSIDPGGDEDHARWELRYAKLSLGVITAERDSLDDQVPALVSHAATEALSSDARIAAAMLPLAERQFAERLRQYRDAVSRRETGVSSAERLGRALVTLVAPGSAENATVVERAGRLASGYLRAANAALQEVFGRAALPDDVRPSEALLR